MFEDILKLVREMNWSGYHISVFEVLLVIFALIKKFSILSLLILCIVLGRGFIEVQQNTDFSGPFIQTVPFILYSACALVFFIYAIVKLFSTE